METHEILTDIDHGRHLALKFNNKHKIIIHGRIPSKKNSRIVTRSGRTFPSKQYTAWHKDASGQVKRHGDIIRNAGRVCLYFFMPDARRTDLTNKAESVMDLLVDCGILKDDCWQVVNEVVLKCCGIDRENPRCEIYLRGEE